MSINTGTCSCRCLGNERFVWFCSPEVSSSKLMIGYSACRLNQVEKDGDGAWSICSASSNAHRCEQYLAMGLVVKSPGEDVDFLHWQLSCCLISILICYYSQRGESKAQGSGTPGFRGSLLGI